MRYADHCAPFVGLSRTFYEAVKLDRRPARELAESVGLSESQFSRMLRGHRLVRLNDPRIIALGKLLRLTRAELFNTEHP